MEINANIADLLREVITFLECLRDAELPITLESLREELLGRSKMTLNVTSTMTRVSPEPYLDMNSGPKSLMLLKKSEPDSEEYVGMESSEKRNHQDHYETFENEDRSDGASNECHEQNDDDTDEGQILIGIYKNLSAAQIRSKCHKCGPLFKKEGRKLFLSENRACWIALIGSHLLVYRNERHNRPCAIHPIRGYMARPAPNLIPRNRQKSESAFEIYRPGNETLRFIARTPKDMDQWITKICEVGRGTARTSKVRADARGKRRALVDEPSSEIDSDERVAIRNRDAGDSIVVDRSTTVKAEATNNKDEKIERESKDEDPPPLPARIPRRLPSLPPDDDAIPSYGASVEDDDDDDDDIYHKIEDLRNGTRYQNMMLSRKQRADRKHVTVAYNDVVRALEESNNEEQKGDGEEKPRDAISSEETYDDIVVLSRIDAYDASSERRNPRDRPVDGEGERKEFYDDVENLISNGRVVKDRAKDRTDTSSKSPQKKSFLDRVLSRKESPGNKSEKKYKGKASSTKEDASTYDDASDLTNRESSAVEGEESPEYNCPPPPRPVYAKSILNGPDEVEDFYDDVNSCREQYKNQQANLRSMQESAAKMKETTTTTTSNAGLENDEGDHPREEVEHYQSPKSDLCIRDFAEISWPNEELYDDIALWADFTSRQRDVSGKRDEDATKSTDKRSWNRFAVNRKSRASDSVDANRRSGANECEEIEDSSDGNLGASKRNTFQKLISRMENSFAKVSARGNPSSLPTGKPNAINNNS